MASKQEAMGTGSNGQLNDKVAPEMASAEEKMETGTNGQPNDKVATAEEVMETSSNGQPNDKVGPEMASAEEVMETSSNGQLSDKVAPKVASVVGTDVLLSNKGVRKVIFYDGYKYRFDKVHNGTEYYFCDTARTKGCSQRLHKPIDNDDPRHFILKGSHIHSGDARKVNKKKVMTKLKDLSKNTKDTIRQVISKSIYDTSKATKAKLPTEKLMAQMVSRYRRGSGVLKNPQNLSELVLEGEYAQTVNKKPFLLHDSMAMVPPEEIEEGVRDRVLIFTTSENLKFLSLCDEYFMDGTFSVTPPLFSQLYTLHGRYKGWHVPLVYTLLTNKKQDTYVDVLKFLHELEPTLNPTDYMVDFEMAAMNAIGEVFPETEVHGCHFHFCQNVWRHIQAVGLQTKYNDNDQFALNLRHLIALAFVPVDSVQEAYDELMDTEFFNSGDSKIEELLDYFQSTYIYALDRKGNKKDAMFPPKIWNVYETVLSGYPRTNNHIEGWHNKINRMWGTHPNIFTFIEQLKGEQDMTELAIAQVEGGKDPGARRQKYENDDKKLIKLVKAFHNDIHDGSFLPYLLSIAHNNRF